MEDVARKPTNHWFHFSLQAIGILFCVYFYFHLPQSGKALLIMGGIVAVMMFMDMRPLHKGIYVAVIVGLIFIENRALDKERTDSAKEQRDRQKEENDKFQAIADGLTGAIRQSQVQFAATMSGIQENIDTVTGGKTFCLVIVSPIENKFSFFISTIGKAPLHGVTVQMVDVDLMKKLVGGKPSVSLEEINRYMFDFPSIPFLASGAGRTLTFVLMDERNSRNFNFNFSSLNGNWSEIVKLRRVHGQWEQAEKIIRMAKLNQWKTMYSYSTPHYPKTNGKVDWEN